MRVGSSGRQRVHAHPLVLTRNVRLGLPGETVRLGGLGGRPSRTDLCAGLGGGPTGPLPAASRAGFGGGLPNVYCAEGTMAVL